VFAIVLPKKFRKNRAWCANSMPQLKKNATPLSSSFDDGISFCVFDATVRGIEMSKRVRKKARQMRCAQ
jgi:hypothetical protein